MISGCVIVLMVHSRLKQCGGSMTFWGGSGSADPCLWLMDPDPVSCYFRHLPSRCQQKTNFYYTIFSAYYFLKLHLHYFSKIKSQKELKIVGIKVFFTIFAWWLKDPDPDPEHDPDPDPYLWLVDPDPGGPKTRGSGFGSATLLVRITRTHMARTW